MTRLSVFIASSIDGYIATLDDKLDWLDAAAVPGEGLRVRALHLHR